MVADTSALFAVLTNEADAPIFAKAIDDAHSRKISALNAFELDVAIARRFGSSDVTRVHFLLKRSFFEVISFDDETRSAATAAYLRFGKGRHPARLNLADCAAYALAQRLNEPLLFKGGDFSKTDIVPAIG